MKNFRLQIWVGAVLWGVLPPIQAQQSPPTFRADVNLLMIEVEVRDRISNRLIAGLGPADFSVSYRSQLRNLQVFETENLPLDVVLAIDTSGGSGRNTPTDLANGLRATVAEMRPGDRLAVISFASIPRLKCNLTDDEDRVVLALQSAMRDRLRMDRLARIYDALMAAVQLFESTQKKGRRRAVVLLTHNRDAGSKMTKNAIRRAVLESDATVHVVVGRHFSNKLSFHIGYRQNPKPPTFLKDLRSADGLAEATGGEVVQYDSIVDGVQDAIRRLRNSYLLGIRVPGPEPRWTREDFKVEVKPAIKDLYPKVLVRTRPRLMNRE